MKNSHGVVLLLVKLQALIVQRIRQIWNIGKNSKIKKKDLNQLQKVRYSQIYQQNLNQDAIQKAIGIPIENLRTSKTKSNCNILGFVTTFNRKKRYPSNSNTL